MVHGATGRASQSACAIQNFISAIFPIIAFALFVLAGILFWPAMGLTILGELLKKDKTEKQDPGAYKIHKWGILLLKILGGVVVLAIIVLILYIVLPTILVSLAGVPPASC